MVAGMFRNTGAYMGDNPVLATVSNKCGYYEDHDINELNNRLIQEMLRWPILDGQVRRPLSVAAHTDWRCFWAAAPRRRRYIQPPHVVAKAMKEFSSKTSFCYKDPRFNVTLHLWRWFLPANTRFIVVFREPQKTINSILRIAHEEYDPPLHISSRWASISWLRNYRRLLNKTSRDGEWLFLHYDQVVSLESASAIERFTDHTLDTGQIDVRLSRSVENPVGRSRLSRHCAAVYKSLCERADRDLLKWSGQANMSKNL